MTRLGPAGRAELRAEHEYRKAHSQLSRDAIDDLDDLTAASLAPGTRADGLRRAAEIVRTWAGGLDDKSVHRACERIAAEINAEIEKEIRSDDYGDRFEIGKGALRTIVTGDLDAKTAHAIAQAGLDVMEHGVDVCRKIRGDA